MQTPCQKEVTVYIHADDDDVNTWVEVDRWYGRRTTNFSRTRYINISQASLRRLSNWINSHRPTLKMVPSMVESEPFGWITFQAEREPVS